MSEAATNQDIAEYEDEALRSRIVPAKWWWQAGRRWLAFGKQFTRTYRVPVEQLGRVPKEGAYMPGVKAEPGDSRDAKKANLFKPRVKLACEYGKPKDGVQLVVLHLIQALPRKE